MKFSGVDDDARHQYSDWLSDMAFVLNYAAVAIVFDVALQKMGVVYW